LVDQGHRLLLYWIIAAHPLFSLNFAANLPPSEFLGSAMMMPTSSEFIDLCRSQLSILTQGLGATFSVVYLMQQLSEGSESQLVPIVADPEGAIHWQEEPLQLPAPTLSASALPLLPAAGMATEPETLSQRISAAGTHPSSSTFSNSTFSDSAFSDSARSTEAVMNQRQVMLPLVQESVMLGLLVVGRDDRGWSPGEQAQIEQIANTLTIACVLDQRYQWLESDRQQERQIQTQQLDRRDNLLHQFRNSLTALQTFGKLILKRLQPDDRNREAASSLVRETLRLRELAQQLEATTNLSTAVQETPPPLALPPASQAAPTVQSPLLMPGSLAETPLIPCSVRSVLEPLLASAVTIAQDRQLALHSLIPEQLPLVWADAQALREVLNNLIENALKYTPAGGHILVQLSLPNPKVSEAGNSPPAWMELSISDTGPGIPEPDLPHIFERRFRGVQAATDIPGTGLGLAIAKALVEQMHGEIEVQSPAQIWETLGVKTRRGTSLKLRLAIVAPDTHEIKDLAT
jgi:signal transduction histidine kinase